MHFIGKLLLIMSFVICNFKHSLQNLWPQNFNVKLLLLLFKNSSKQISQYFCLLLKEIFFSLLLFKN